MGFHNLEKHETLELTYCHLLHHCVDQQDLWTSVKEMQEQKKP